MTEQHVDERGYFFYGRHRLTLDEKKRLLVPAEVRRSIDARDGTAFFMVVGQNDKLWFYPDQYYKRLALRYKSGIFVNEDVHTFKLMHYGLAERLEWDRQGRMVIPDDALQYSGLRKDVILVGADDHLELWNREDWSALMVELAKKRKEILLKAEQAQKEV